MAAVCDPIGDPEPYLQIAEQNGMKIFYVVDTHVHADHISTGRRLAELTSAKYVLHASAGTQYEFFRVDEGDVLDLGNVQIKPLHTPGHTPEHICLLVTDKTRGPEPWFLLSGHTLMVGDLGRTELVFQCRRRGTITLQNNAEAESSSRPYRSAAGRFFRVGMWAVPEREADVHDWLRTPIQQGFSGRQ